MMCISNKNEKQKQSQSQSGFVALFIVMCIGFLTAVFGIGSMERGWVEAKNVSEVYAVAEARFNAISCIAIARLKLFLGETSIEGIYDLRNGTRCEIESIVSNTNKIVVRVRSTDQYNPNIWAIFEAEIDSQSLGIISLREL